MKEVLPFTTRGSTHSAQEWKGCTQSSSGWAELLHSTNPAAPDALGF